MLPSTDFSDSDLLAIATEELQGPVTELLLSVREEYLVASADQSVVAGTAAYQIPARAVGGVVREVLLSTDSGTTFLPLARIEPEREHDATGTNPVGFKFENNTVVLLPTPTASATLRIRYFRRPNALVANGSTISAAAITAINTGTKTLTFTSTSGLTATGATYDFVQASPGFMSLADDQPRTSTTGTTIVFTNVLPSLLAVGDYVCLAGVSLVPQVPVELHQLLVQRVVMRTLEALGDKKVDVAQNMVSRAEKQALSMLMPRSQGNQRPIINKFGPGWRNTLP
jgi:hypothetical protein